MLLVRKLLMIRLLRVSCCICNGSLCSRWLRLMLRLVNMLLRWVVCIIVLLKVVVIVFCRLQVMVVVRVFQIWWCLNSGMVISSSVDFKVSVMLQCWFSCRVLFWISRLLSIVFSENVISSFYRWLIVCQLFCVSVMLSWLVLLVMWLIV